LSLTGYLNIVGELSAIQRAGFHPEVDQSRLLMVRRLSLERSEKQSAAQFLQRQSVIGCVEFDGAESELVDSACVVRL
jgi:hypothetical protein